ncbi:uncharacterized protein LOC112459066 [Temnothorax curvispinosus]|uniref:Uncharacterized protein LOC112459066 n=1 Tax=Temnothorax curvispinosus TaxID=300111 RepID=A0A6J1QBL6_9HYME|nr:uncharacterized protein LOC112459066 [Temnothorax curvispinosus]
MLVLCFVASVLSVLRPTSHRPPVACVFKILSPCARVSSSKKRSITMEEIRVMWCDALEELLQCPVCLEATQGVKVQCVNGHHICNPCRVQLQVCPICKSPFMGTRNLAVEQISAKLQDIKLSLLNPYHALNRRTLHNKICVATQTEDIVMPSTACQTEPVTQAKPITPRNEQQKFMLNLAPRVGKGLYPCRIGTCVMELPHGRMIGHLRYHHKDVFYEFNAKDNILKKKWTLEYILNRDYDFAFHIKEMGLFFLNISINQMGDLMGFLQIVNHISVSKQFTYTFEAIGTFNATYNGPVKSCRIPRQNFSNDCLRIRENNMRHLIDNKNCFHCNLTIKRRVDYRAVNAQNNPVPAPDDIVDN